MAVYLYAAFLTLMLLGLTYNVILRRRKLKIGLGHGEDEGLARAIRAHANFTEFVPYCLLLIFMAESAGATPFTIHVLGLTLIVARLLHVWGLTSSSGYSFGRFTGTILTHLVLLGGAAFCVYFYFYAPTAD
jgi:uncharacterized membrane protein YecN with MAPEG domain